MNCDAVQDQLSEHIDRRLDAQTRAIIDAHLSSCVDCRVEAEELAQSVQFVAAEPPIDPPSVFATRVMAHVREETVQENVWQRLLRSFRVHIPAQATAVVLVAALVVILYQKERPLERTVQMETPPTETSLSSPTNAQITSEAGTSREHSRPDTGVMADHELVLRVGPTTRESAAPAGRLESAASGFSFLSEEQAKNLMQARQRALQTGQAQNELLNIPRDQYERFREELAAIGDIETDSFRKTPSPAQTSGPLLVVRVTILPRSAPAGTAPAQPGVP